eukprot:1159903-Pelagomonas_calceolata.AAC.5
MAPSLFLAGPMSLFGEALAGLLVREPKGCSSEIYKDKVLCDSVIVGPVQKGYQRARAKESKGGRAKIRRMLIPSHPKLGFAMLSWLPTAMPKPLLKEEKKKVFFFSFFREYFIGMFDVAFMNYFRKYVVLNFSISP